MQYVKTRVGKIAVDVNGDGPPLLMLHSVAHDHHDYDDVVPTLSRDFQTIAVDWPGHGDSEMWSPPESARAGLLFDALEDLVDALALSPAIIMGNSIGGGAALHLAARRPERVRGLVLVDSSGSADSSSAAVRTVCWLQGRNVVRSMTGMSFARWYLRTEGPGRQRLLERLASQRERAGFIDMDAAMWRSFGTPENDLREEARNVKAPTLIVWGKHDPVIRAQVEGKRLRELIPHAEYAELDCGHTPFVEKPSDFLDAVTPFLRKTRVWRAETEACTNQ